MPYGVTSEGFEPKPQDVIESEVKTQLRDGISPTLNLGSRSLLGQFVSAVCAQLAQLWEAQQAGYAARDPNQATGDALRGIAAYTGTTPRAAAPSSADIITDLAAGTYAVGVLKVSRAGSPDVIFANVEEITTAGGTGLGPFRFESLDTGPISAPPNTLTVVVDLIAGFANPTNPAAADEGNNADNDAQLRIRREQDLARRGSTSVDAIRADLLNEDNVPGVDYVAVLENDQDTTDVNGLPGHSVEAIVLGGTDADIANTLWNSKAAGVYTHGTESVVVTDTSGNDHTVRFSRPTAVPIEFSGSFDYLESAWASDTDAEEAVTEALLAAFAVNQGVGKDVIHSRYVQAVMGVAGAIDIALGVAEIPNVVSTSNVVIGVREYATLDAGDISISGIPQSAPP